MKKRAVMILFAAIASISCAACSSNTSTMGQRDTQVKSEDVTKAEDKTEDEDTQKKINSEEESTQNTYTAYNETPGEEYHAGMKKIGDDMFFYASSGIYTVNLKSNQTKTLVEAPEGSSIEGFCMDQGKIYYIQTTREQTDLYRIGMDEIEPELLVQKIKGNRHISVYEHILYLSSYGVHECYAIQPDLSVKELEDGNTYYSMLSQIDSDQGMLQDMLSVGDSLNRFQKIWTADEQGNVWCFTLEDKQSTQYIVSPNSAIGVKEPYLMLIDYGESGRELYLYNVDTKQRRKWITGNEEYLDSDENGAYFSIANEENTKITYEYVTWDGTKTTLFEVSPIPGMKAETAWGVRNFAVIDQTIYYQFGENGKMYLMSRPCADPSKVTVHGEAYDDFGFGEYGHIELHTDTEYFQNQSDKPYIDVSYEQLVFDGHSKADGKINEMFSKIRETSIHDYIQRAKEDMTEEYIPNYSYSSIIDRVTTLSDRYICVKQEEYLFAGGAHGMPGRQYYLLDLETGDQLTLQDVVSDDLKTVREKAAAKFQTMYDADPAAYLDDAAEIVAKTAGENEMFYLTQDGIVFYFAPYDLACYAAGFIEVKVPYEELNLKLHLK